MLANAMVVMIFQYINWSNQHIVHLNYDNDNVIHQLYINKAPGEHVLFHPVILTHSYLYFFSVFVANCPEIFSKILKVKSTLPIEKPIFFAWSFILRQVNVKNSQHIYNLAVLSSKTDGNNGYSLVPLWSWDYFSPSEHIGVARETSINYTFPKQLPPSLRACKCMVCSSTSSCISKHSPSCMRHSRCWGYIVKAESLPAKDLEFRSRQLPPRLLQESMNPWRTCSSQPTWFLNCWQLVFWNKGAVWG